MALCYYNYCGSHLPDKHLGIEKKNAEAMLIFFHKSNECDVKRRKRELCIVVEELCLFPCILGKPTQVQEEEKKTIQQKRNAGQRVQNSY